MVRLLLALSLLLGLPVLVAAEGTTVGPTCKVSWLPVTEDVGGRPLTGTVAYNIWITTTPTPNPLPGPRSGTTTALQWDCANVGEGQRYVWLNAQTALNGTSAMTGPIPFVYRAAEPPPPVSPPEAPTGVTVGP
jgi:hypothetical protein